MLLNHKAQSDAIIDRLAGLYDLQATADGKSRCPPTTAFALANEAAA